MNNQVRLRTLEKRIGSTNANPKYKVDSIYTFDSWLRQETKSKNDNLGKQVLDPNYLSPGEYFNIISTLDKLTNLLDRKERTGHPLNLPDYYEIFKNRLFTEVLSETTGKPEITPDMTSAELKKIRGNFDIAVEILQNKIKRN